jgi:hypothetical protein
MSEHFRCYIPKGFRGETLSRINRANIIIEEYERRGYSLTLRQLYYQHVARGYIENNEKEYNRLKSIVSDGRLAGLISWTAIEDRTRNLRGLQTFTCAEDLLNRVKGTFRFDLWVDQPCRPEVWVEKDALVDVVGQICDQLRVDFFACRGYVSQSEQWRAGQRLAGYVNKGQRPIIFHLGDHDPSGIDMTRDNTERLSMFAGVPIQVVRLALNRDQIARYNPPPNPAKETDVRFSGYRAEHGDSSWELDALDPQVIHDLIEEAVLRVRDPVIWDKSLLAEVQERQLIEDMISEMREGE